jgi:hypothetical protein
MNEAVAIKFKFYFLAWLKPALVILHWLVLVTCYGLLTYSALLRFNVSWDYMAYHLPAALSRFGLTTYEPNPHLVEVIRGFPPLAHLTQGFLVYLTGRITAANGANAVAFLFAILVISRLFVGQISIRWFLTFCLAVPLVVMHFNSGYIDLFSGVFLLLAFAALVLLCREDSRINTAGTLFILSSTAASLSKCQAWPILAVLFFGFAFQIFWLLRQQKVVWQRASLLLILAVAGISAWPIRNTLVFDNPTYPFRPPLIGSLFSNYSQGLLDTSGTGPPTFIANQTPAYLSGASPSWRFTSSMLELNRRFSQVPYSWPPLDRGENEGSQSPHHRMGGLFPITILALAALTGLGVRRGVVPILPLAVFVAAILFLAFFIPQNHELRYWLFIPLTLAYFAALSIKACREEEGLVIKVVFLSLTAFVWLSLGLMSVPGEKNVDAVAPAEARAFWHNQSSGKEATAVNMVCGKMPWTIFWSGPHLREFSVKECL